MASIRWLVCLVLLLAGCGENPTTHDSTGGGGPTALASVLIDVHAAGSGSGHVASTPAGIDCGATCTFEFPYDTVVTLTAVPDATSVFVGWSGACAGTSPTCKVTAVAPSSVTATFAPKTHTVTVDRIGAGEGKVTGSGIACGAECTTTVEHGETIHLAAAPIGSSHFTGWGGPCTGTGACELTVTDDATITAAFSLDDVTLMVTRTGTGTGTVTSNPAGILCGSDCDETYPVDQEVQLTAKAANGSTFTGWSGVDCPGTGTCTVKMSAAVHVTAAFKPVYELTVVVEGTGSGTVTSNVGAIDCDDSCSDDYEAGTVVTLTPAETTGSTFTSWGGACPDEAPTCEVSMDQARTVTATFTLDTHVLDVTTAGSGNVTSNVGGIDCPGACSDTYGYDTSVTLTAAPDVDWVFAGWDGACTGDGPCVVEIDAAKSVNATFAPSFNDLNVFVLGGGMVLSSDETIACASGGGSCASTYAFGATVTLIAAPFADQTFVGWSGACTGNGSCLVTMGGARNVTAVFEPL